MRLVIQRVTEARVRSGGAVLGEIGAGAVVLTGVAAGDTLHTVDRMAAKLVGLRYFRGDDGRTDIDIRSADGAYLVVSQFTLLADLRRGRRPGFTRAAAPEIAEPLVARFMTALEGAGIAVRGGRFGAEMQVELVNDGPFTLVLDSDRDLAAI